MRDRARPLAWAPALLLLAGALLLAPAGASAQDETDDAGEAATLPVVAVEPLRPDPGPPPATADEDGGARVLPEIVVTAQKREQTLQQVPASVSTLDRKLVRESGAFGFPDLQAYTSNISIRLTPATSDIYIRGFGTASTNAGFEPSVASVVDGVYYGRSTFLGAFFSDIDRVEVLRGPQGSLFGKNSSAGVMNLVTAAPEADFGAAGELLWGDFGERSLRPVVNLPVGEDLALRYAGNYAEHQGLLHNTRLNRPEYNVHQESSRLRLRYHGPGPLAVDLAGFSSSQHLNNNVFQLSQANPAMVALAQTYDGLAEASARNFLNSNNVPSIADVAFSGLSGTVGYDLAGFAPAFDALALTSVTAWAGLRQNRREFDADFSPVPFIRVSQLQPSPFRQWSQELRVAGSADALFGFGHGIEFVAGAYAFESRLAATDEFLIEDLGAAFAYLGTTRLGGALPAGSAGQLFGASAPALDTLLRLIDPVFGPAFGERQAAIVTLDQAVRSWALFAQFEHRFASRWGLIGGLRVGRERKTGLSTSTAQGELIPLIADQADHVSPLSRDESELSPKLGLKWAWTPDTNLYGTWSRGYKSGGFNALALNDDNLEFGPERATSLEGGIKSRLFGGSMRISAALFDTDFTDLQVSTFRNASFFILNAAEARSRGAELDLHWLPPLPGSALFASLGYTDARYRSYPDAPAPADAPAPPDPACEPNCPRVQDLTGRRLPIAPRWSASLVPSFTAYVPLTRLTANLALDLLYRSDRYLDVDLDPRTRQPATTELNLRLTLGTLRDDWRLTLAARNLTDEVIYEQVLDQPLAPGNFAAIRGDRGRFWSANLSIGF